MMWKFKKNTFKVSRCPRSRRLLRVTRTESVHFAPKKERAVNVAVSDVLDEWDGKI